MSLQEDSITPEFLLQISGAYWRTCTLHAGVALDVFTVMEQGPLTAERTAELLNADLRATRMLLNALAAMNLLLKKGEAYSNSAAASRWLVKTSPDYLGYMIRHHHHLVEAWGRLPISVKEGKPVKRESHGEEEERESFLMGMFNLAMAIAPRVASTIDLSGKARLLDLGGGPGTYAIHFCLHNPELRAVVFDLPTTEVFARKTFERFGVSDRVDFIAGNFSRDPIPEKFDVVWLSQVLHGESPEEAARLVHKAVRSLEPGGMILIHEFILNDTMDGPLFPALFSLNMLVNTPHGQAYSQGQLTQMLEDAGARNVRRLDFRGPTDSGIVAADA